MQQQTFLWHDYETFGVNARRDRPAQFAAIRTDADFNEIGEPMMLYCQPAPDFLPQPQACLITGITPQLCLEQGLPEYQFAQKINEAFSQPGTIGVGYNTIRFDDEITRFMLWRNLLDPYAREWQHQCGRWDILDMVRTAYALRPEGMHWPLNEQGRPSFKLEHLCAANGIMHESAHDALSDVRATIALAKLVRQLQPKLVNFCFSLHKKQKVAIEIGLPEQRPFLHITGMIPAENGCMCIAWPLAAHPGNKNEIIFWDLAHDPAELLGMNADAIRQRLFSKADALPEGVTRLPVKTIHLTKSPIVIGRMAMLTPEVAERWGISIEVAMQHAQHAAALPDMNAIWQEVYNRQPSTTSPVDVDLDLYGGFVGNADRATLTKLSQCGATQLAIMSENSEFQDERLAELVFRYRARNFPASLSETDAQRWSEHCAMRFFDGAAGALTVDDFFAEIDQLSENAGEYEEGILGALYDYAEHIVPVR